MRTTLKRGVGRGAEVNGNGGAVYPPGPVSAVTRYGPAPLPPPRSGFSIMRRILVATLVVISVIAIGIGGGAYLWVHQEVDAIRAHSIDVKTAQRKLDVQLPGQAAIALVIGYDQRKGKEFSDVSRSDTVMLVRADPGTNTISLLSIPRDLGVPVYCPKNGQTSLGVQKINQAYADCESPGTLDTVRHFTGLQTNYLIKVNFHGFQEIVDKLGGVWLDIDRRYYHVNTGTAAENYSAINLQPGYQLLSGAQALSFVRYRH